MVGLALSRTFRRLWPATPVTLMIGEPHCTLRLCQSAAFISSSPSHRTVRLPVNLSVVNYAKARVSGSARPRVQGLFEQTLIRRPVLVRCDDIRQ
jgi:hypothetical protein